jgi:hypothetical protein
VTTVPGPAGRNGQSGSDAAARLRGQLPPPRRSWFARDPSWPIVVTLVGWPVWWYLGIVENHIFLLMAIPMLVRMNRWSKREGRKVKLPPGFGLWMLFMIVSAAGIFTLTLTAPDTIKSSSGATIFSFLSRFIDYGGAFVFLVYAGNLTERELPRRRLAWLLGLVGLYCVAGGFLGIVDPHFQLTSPLTHLLPSKLQGLAAVNPGSAQNMAILGYAEGRVKAPFAYTNVWGNALAITLPWLIVAWRSYRTARWQRWAVDAVVALTIIPVVYALDRGLWIGIAFALLYLGVRYAAMGRFALIGALIGTVAVVGVLIVASPIGTMISQREANGKSNQVRASTSSIAIKDGLSSPIIGYGDSRRMQGGTNSITTGRSSGCAKCGNSEVGTSGQGQLLMVTSGVAGVITYSAFFLYGIWRYRRDRSPYGLCGVLVLLLGFVFFPIYTATGPPDGFMMLAYAILWKNDREMRKPAEPEPTGMAQPAPAVRNGRMAITGSAFG